MRESFEILTGDWRLATDDFLKTHFDFLAKNYCVSKTFFLL
jgi:hypothetical protein